MAPPHRLQNFDAGSCVKLREARSWICVAMSLEPAFAQLGQLGQLGQRAPHAAAVRLLPHAATGATNRRARSSQGSRSGYQAWARGR